MSLPSIAAEARRAARLTKTLADALAYLAPASYRAIVGDSAPEAAGVKLLAVLVEEGTRRESAAQAVRQPRPALVWERYAKPLARGLALQLVAGPPPGSWASVEKAALHRAYMAGTPAQLAYNANHPGSRAGLVVVDLRTPQDFADQHGATTEASILARVMGRPRAYVPAPEIHR